MAGRQDEARSGSCMELLCTVHCALCTVTVYRVHYFCALKTLSLKSMKMNANTPIFISSSRCAHLTRIACSQRKANISARRHGSPVRSCERDRPWK